ncbi:hypothetical protein SAMN04487913_101364 [Arthrobacter sp. ok362]|nr:hypothetical protein SAMN04487913_101364 [Arthrobacter sp. ok362]
MLDLNLSGGTDNSALNPSKSALEGVGKYVLGQCRIPPRASTNHHSTVSRAGYRGDPKFHGSLRKIALLFSRVLPHVGPAPGDKCVGNEGHLAIPDIPIDIEVFTGESTKVKVHCPSAT